MGACSVKKKDILYFAAVLVVLACILGLYKINSLIPDGIFVSGVPQEKIEKMYPGLYVKMTAYDRGTVLITPEKGAAQILAFTLAKKFPDACVRDLATERGMRLAALVILSCVVMFAVFNHMLLVFLRGKGKEYRYLLRLGEFFVLCFLVRGRGMLPAACIPRKFIFLGEWWTKCRGYFDSLRAAGKIPCEKYQAFAVFQWGLAILLIVGTVGVLAAGRTGKANGVVLGRR